MDNLISEEFIQKLKKLGILDYRKIIHICEERIRQLENE